MPSPINTEWLNENAYRAYPLREDVSRVPRDDSGDAIEGVVLPNYVILDFIVTLATSSNRRAYLQQLAYVGNLLTLVFADDAEEQIAALTVDLNTHSANQAYDFYGTGTYEDARGKIVVGDLSELYDDLGEGLFTFTLSDTEFETRTVRPDLRGVRSLQISNSGVESGYLYGHIKLIAGANVKLTYVAAQHGIRIDGIEGEGTGLNEECDCEDDIGANNVVRTINGIPIEDVTIVGDGQCVDVQTAGNQITISDICSQPCCDCPELEFLTESMKILEASVDNLESYAQQLATRIQNFVTNYILTISAI